MISVITPVYKALVTLPRCVKSVLEQSYSDLELILVDDGSPDASGKLCDAFAITDARVRVIHQFNQGVSAARNAGLAQANGEWVIFLDADDALAPCALEVALAAQKRNPNRLILWTHCDSPEKLPKTPNISGEMFAPDRVAVLYAAWCISMPWNKLFSLSIIRQAGLSFDPAFSLGEDLLFCLAYFKAFFFRNGEGFFRLSQPQTYYNTQENIQSLTQKYRADFCDLWIDLYGRLIIFCKDIFHCPTNEMALVYYCYLNTLAAGIDDILRRGTGTKRTRHTQALAVLRRPELSMPLNGLKEIRLFTPYWAAFYLGMPCLVRRLYGWQQRRPSLFGKLRAIGQNLWGHTQAHF